MSPRARFMNALRGEPVDRPPVAHVAAMATVELQKSTGCFMPEAHHDAEKLVLLMGANHDILGFDAVTFIINFFNEPAALGAELDWGGPTQLPAYTSHPWQNARDAVMPDDFLDRPPVSTNLRAFEIAKQRYGERIAVLGKVMGPLSMVQVMHGLDATMTALVTDPDLMRNFLDVATDILIASANSQFALGVDAITIGEGGAGAQMLSPEMYERVLLPFHKRMIAAINGPTIMHICGDIMPRLHMLADTGLTCFNFDWAIPPKTMVEAAKGRFSTMGNVNTADLLNADPAEIERQVMTCIDAGVNIISPGCAVSPNCPNANLRAMVEAAAKR
jgi:methylthiol:coenzyme M methyltransferase